MILVGQYDSPFVRLVGITLAHQGMPFVRDRTSVFSADMARVSPLVRIPTLVLDDGERLFDLRLRLAEAFPEGRYPALEALAARCEALDAFRATLASPDEVMPAAGSARRA